MSGGAGNNESGSGTGTYNEDRSGAVNSEAMPNPFAPQRNSGPN